MNEYHYGYTNVGHLDTHMHTYITNLWFISNCESTEIAAVWESAITDYPLNLAVETFVNWTLNIFNILRLIPTWGIQLTQRCNEMD